MKVPLKITFRDIESSDAIETAVREKVAKLDAIDPRITACHVTIEAPHRRHHKGRIYHVRIDLSVPGEEIVVGRDSAVAHAHEDLYVALRDAFDAARRQLLSRNAKRRESRNGDRAVVPQLAEPSPRGPRVPSS